MVLLPDLILIGFNITNAYIDAYKITSLRKSIRHGINLGAYLTVWTVVAYFFYWPQEHWLLSLLVCFVSLISALACRQITFDIPLNWRRGLDWDYVSLDRPPKAWWDQLEVRLFGYNGRLPVLIYSIIWVNARLILHCI